MHSDDTVTVPQDGRTDLATAQQGWLSIPDKSVYCSIAVLTPTGAKLNYNHRGSPRESAYPLKGPEPQLRGLSCLCCRHRALAASRWIAGAAHSIISSARASSVGGTVRPSALAVLRLRTNSKRVTRSIGRSWGFSPRSSRSA